MHDARSVITAAIPIHPLPPEICEQTFAALLHSDADRRDCCDLVIEELPSEGVNQVDSIDDGANIVVGVS